MVLPEGADLRHVGYFQALALSGAQIYLPNVISKKFQNKYSSSKYVCFYVFIYTFYILDK